MKYLTNFFTLIIANIGNHFQYNTAVKNRKVAILIIMIAFHYLIMKYQFSLPYSLNLHNLMLGSGGDFSRGILVHSTPPLELP